MYDPLTYIYPRTMEQAFGPRAVLTVEDEDATRMDKIDKIVAIVCAIAAFTTMVLLAWEGTR